MVLYIPYTAKGRVLVHFYTALRNGAKRAFNI